MKRETRLRLVEGLNVLARDILAETWSDGHDKFVDLLKSAQPTYEEADAAVRAIEITGRTADGGESPDAHCKVRPSGRHSESRHHPGICSACYRRMPATECREVSGD